MTDLERVVDDAVRASGFAGAVRIDVAGRPVLAVAHGYADRAHLVPNTIDTRFGIASGTKGLTALTVISLVVDGALQLATPARDLLGDDLPLIDDDVTVEHLLAHTSGIGDYLDEEDEGLDVLDHVLPIPLHRLDTTDGYLPLLEGHPPKFTVGERFAYSNSGYVVLALLAERATARTPFATLVHERVCVPAGMGHTAFLRSDELPGDAAVGYLLPEPDLRTNVHHLPIRGSGDGGIATTVGDLRALWVAIDAGQVVPPEWVEAMRRPRHHVPDGSKRYGLGFWLAQEGPGVALEGSDAGVSFASAHDPTTDTTWTVVSNSTDGAWPVARAIREAL